MISELQARKNAPVKLWIDVNKVESSALDQLRNVADLPNVFMHVAAMPDVHTGMGATVGSVIAMNDAVIPAAVGVDIGCGMDAIQTNLEAHKLRASKLERIRDGILERIPVGFNSHNSLHKNVKMHNLWTELKDLGVQDEELHERAKHQLGTLGGGNHFIELEEDQFGNVWIMLHSGSRNIGLQIANHHIRVAKQLEHNKNLPDKALSYLLKGTPEFDAYMHDLKWAQRYAYANRTRMMELLIGYLLHEFPGMEGDLTIGCHHNFAQEEEHFNEEVVVIRKGAIQARKDQWGIIPGAMGSKSYIVQGKGNLDSFESAPHGAGRKMSRSKAKAKYRFQDLQETMSGIVCNASKSTVDEIKHSYKRIEDVMTNAQDLVEPRYELTQLLNIKG